MKKIRTPTKSSGAEMSKDREGARGRLQRWITIYESETARKPRNCRCDQENIRHVLHVLYVF